MSFLYSHGLVLAYLAIHSGLVLQLPSSTRRSRILATNGTLFLLFLLPFLLPAEEEAFSTLPSAIRSGVVWSPLIFFWWAYLWAGHTLKAVFPSGRTLDPAIIRFEQRRLGQPSLHWARRGSRFLCEILHFFYFSYYLYTPVLGLYLQLTGRPVELQALILAVCFGYFLSYSLFAFTPAWGPRWGLVAAGLLRPDEQRLHGYVFTRLIDRIMYGGPAHQGGAMPSSHSSTAVVFLIWCGAIWGPAGAIPAAVTVTGMWAGAIYGRYHYVTDLLAGALIGLAGVWLAGWLIGI